MNHTLLSPPGTIATSCRQPHRGQRDESDGRHLISLKSGSEASRLACAGLVLLLAGCSSITRAPDHLSAEEYRRLHTPDTLAPGEEGPDWEVGK